MDLLCACDIRALIKCFRHNSFFKKITIHCRRRRHHSNYLFRIQRVFSNLHRPFLINFFFLLFFTSINFSFFFTCFGRFIVTEKFETDFLSNTFSFELFDIFLLNDHNKHRKNKNSFTHNTLHRRHKSIFENFNVNNFLCFF